MLFSKFCTIAALICPSFAAIQFTSFPTTVQAGQTYVLTWTTDDTGPVTIDLKNGSPTNLQEVEVLTAAGTGGSFSWTAPANLADGEYAFQISSGTDNNYSSFFSYTGGDGSFSATGASSAASTAASSAAASSGASSAAASTAASSATTGTTLTSSTAKKTSSTTTATAATATSTIPSGAGAKAVASPIALVLGAAVALAIV